MTDWKPGDPIGYVQSDIPRAINSSSTAVVMPAYMTDGPAL